MVPLMASSTGVRCSMVVSNCGGMSTVHERRR